MNVTISKATILQIIPLPGDDFWWDEHNRALGAALVELEGTYSDGQPFHGREVLPLGADLTVQWPSGCSDAYYDAHVLGDIDRTFVATQQEHREHTEFSQALKGWSAENEGTP